MVPFFLFYSITYTPIIKGHMRTKKDFYSRQNKNSNNHYIEGDVTTAVWFQRSWNVFKNSVVSYRLAILQWLQSNICNHLSHFLMNSRMRSISMGTLANFVFSNLFFLNKKTCEFLSFISGVLVSAWVPGRPLHRLQRRPLLPVPLWD